MKDVQIGEWYKDGYFWCKKSIDGSDGKGDLIFNTCYKIFKEKDISEWAHKALKACSELLNEGNRWPDRMCSEADADSWIERIVVRSLKKIGIKTKGWGFRYQKRMVRDSFIALYTASLFLEVPKYIKDTPIPKFLYSFKTWKWRRRLLEDARVDYVIRLDYLRANAVVLNYKGT